MAIFGKNKTPGYIALCDVSLVDIFGCDGLPAINRQV
jgi:hypothetical protein